MKGWGAGETAIHYNNFYEFLGAMVPMLVALVCLWLAWIVFVGNDWDGMK